MEDSMREQTNERGRTMNISLRTLYVKAKVVRLKSVEIAAF